MTNGQHDHSVAFLTRSRPWLRLFCGWRRRRRGASVAAICRTFSLGVRLYQPGVLYSCHGVPSSCRVIDDGRGERVAVPVEFVRALSCGRGICVVWVRRVLFGTGDSWTVACGASVSATATCVVRKQIPSTLASYSLCVPCGSW